MKVRHLSVGLAAAVMAASVGAASMASAEDTIMVPNLSYRTGPYAPNGIPFANGMADFWTLLNERDGGIGGVKIDYEECETGYNTKVGVECYEKLKSKNPVVVPPNSTGITYQLIPKAPIDKIPVFSMGYGRTSAADGRVFPWIFNFPTTYWNQATAVIRYIGQQEGSLDKLKGKKIAHIYHNSAYGKEANPTLEVLAKKHGFKLTLLAVDHPGQEQRATWLQIRKLRPDWIFMSGWGVMNQVAIKEASSIGFKMDRFIGNWWSGTEGDVLPAGAGANGYKATTFHAPGSNYPLHDEIRKNVYAKGKGAGEEGRIGEVLYNRGMLWSLFVSEAIRGAQAKFSVGKVTGEQVRWAFENLAIDEKRWAELGLPNFTGPIKVTCADHEGAHPVQMQQWDATAKQWKIQGGLLQVMSDVTRPMIEADATKFAKENNITPRKCS
jgi:branched-chain amino acid transport system substrate-binding protein